MEPTPKQYGGFSTRKRAPGNARFPVPGMMEDEFNQRVVRAMESALKGPFRGLTAGPEKITGLFYPSETGIPTDSIAKAAQEFLALLTPDAQASATFPTDGSEWRRWANNTRPIGRHGLLLETMTDEQRMACLRVVEATMSRRGYDSVRGVMKLNETLAEIVESWNELGEWLYFFSVFGTPSEREPWGWQLDGHHCIVNCFVLGDQVVLTPTFLGAEPAIADRGRYVNVEVLGAEQRNGMEMMLSLSQVQRSRATVFPSVLEKDLPPGRWAHGDGRLVAGAYKDNVVLPYEGIQADELSAGQREVLLSLVETYTGRLRPGHDRLWLADVQKHLDETWFSWIGGHGSDDVFYYRVQSPVIFIEFDHQSGVFLDNDDPERFHMHTLVRTPNGNDYGRDLLRQHYATEHGAR